MKRILIFFSLLGTLLLLPYTANAVSMDHFRLNGFFDLEYEKSYSDDAKIGDTKGSFDQYHFNLLMEFPVSDNLTVKGHVEYEHGPQLPGKGELKIEWSYVEYLLSNSIRLKGGLALTPFGIYNEIHDATPTYLSVRPPLGIYKTTSVGGHAMFPKFSTGLFALGSYFTKGDFNLNYVLYIANGENFSKNEAEKDENSNKAIGGRVMISPINGLTVGGSYYAGKKQTAATVEEDHTAWIGSAAYTFHPIGLRAEYALSDLGDTTQVGWYGEASYAIRKFTPYLRYGTFDPNDDTDNDEWTELVYGINYQVQPNLILKLENRQFTGESGNSKINDDYNEMAAAVTVAF